MIQFHTYIHIYIYIYIHIYIYIYIYIIFHYGLLQDIGCSFLSLLFIYLIYRNLYLCTSPIVTQALRLSLCSQPQASPQLCNKGLNFSRQSPSVPEDVHLRLGSTGSWLGRSVLICLCSPWHKPALNFSLILWSSLSVSANLPISKRAPQGEGIFPLSQLPPRDTGLVPILFNKILSSYPVTWWPF